MATLKKKHMQNPKNDKAMVCNMVITFSKGEHSREYNRKKVKPNYKVTSVETIV